MRAMRSRTTLAAVVVGSLIGTAMGIGGFTFFYAQGASYLTNDPQACANCHVMNAQLEGWVKGTHRTVAVCNDCHAPHDFIGKYTTKMINGYFHSYAFTTGDFLEPIRITERNRRVTEGACRSCHADLVEQIDGAHRGTQSLACLHCHPGVGHATLASVGTVPREAGGAPR
jgi:cytochrome c nitrite reductase small subunit